ncbi:hypothetical protein TRAPUB_7000 [Trametes pubescens]|uniref:Uncharacterized protein n=1 Tax=Trametes pubescens TaxID=154538 RepID=A0A1M2V4F3_TRAPU|nr:hypothetical protein TRAPUB_7000 [Trametes pubescens]
MTSNIRKGAPTAGPSGTSQPTLKLEKSEDAPTRSSAAQHSSNSVLKLLKRALEADRETQIKLLCILEKEVGSETEESLHTAKRARLQETPDAFGLHPLKVDQRIILSLQRGFNVPLTLFTAEAITAVSERWTALTLEERDDGVNDEDVNCVVTSTWPPEDAMLPDEWREAYGYFLETLSAFLPEREVARFRGHYEFLAGQNNFDLKFPTILRFDIGVRGRYFHKDVRRTFEPGSHKYARDFLDRCIDDNTERVRQIAQEQERWDPREGRRHSVNDRYYRTNGPSSTRW